MRVGGLGAFGFPLPTVYVALVVPSAADLPKETPLALVYSITPSCQREPLPPPPLPPSVALYPKSIIPCDDLLSNGGTC